MAKQDFETKVTEKFWIRVKATENEILFSVENPSMDIAINRAFFEKHRKEFDALADKYTATSPHKLLRDIVSAVVEAQDWDSYPEAQPATVEEETSEDLLKD